MPTVLELFPNPGVERNLRGLHLAHEIRSHVEPDDSFVFSGFITSIDGRIGSDDSVGAPRAIRNDRDWRLFQELMVQADVVLVSGRYVRDVARGKAINIVPAPGDGNTDDLIRHRVDRGLPARPAVAVVTRSGGFDASAAAGLSDHVIIAHGAEVGSDVTRSWAEAGLDAVGVGVDGDVDVDRLMSALAQRGHRIVFSAAGPGVLAMLVPRLDALYVTLGAQLLGGRNYLTLLEGDELDPPSRFTVASVYLDRNGPGRATQLFLEYRSDRSSAR
ncbi:MAG: dihydrofolate reductase family protein [Actinomycetia bacterium]|nr:dihydrofolate reductase family protein [Actinomycetes bacterium]